MTACIVGWSHTPFGRRDGDDVEALIGEVAGAALADAGVAAADIDDVFVGQINAGFQRQEFPVLAGAAERAGPALQAVDAGGERLRHRLGRDPWRPHQHRGQARSAGARGRRREDDGYRRPGDRQHPAEGQLCEGGGGDGGRLRRHLRQDRPALLPEAWRPVRRARPYRRQEPQERRRQSASRRCARTWATTSAAAVSEKNPIVAWPLKRTDCSLVSDGAAAVVLADVETALTLRKAIWFRAAEQVNDFLPHEPARYHAVRRRHRGVAAGAGERAAGARRSEPGRDP